jgi:hypothetical protein
MDATPRQLKFTSRSIESVQVAKRTDFTDPDHKGLTLRVTPGGTRTWALLYRRRSDGKKRRVTIGEFPEKGLAAANGKVASLITIKNAFDQDQTLAEIGGIKYLAQLVAHAASPMSAKAYADLLCELAARRSAITAARELIAEASTIAAHESFRPAIEVRP